jgi:Na+/proline symporter
VGVLWARYWRRLRLVSAGQIYESRYGGVAAARFRGFFVVWSALVTSAVVLGYVLQGFAQIMAPFLGWPVDVVLLVFCGVSMAYTAMSGLFGVAFSDVAQFALLLLGRLALAVVLVGAAGGMGEILAEVERLRGPEFLQPFPPAAGLVGARRGPTGCADPGQTRGSIGPGRGGRRPGLLCQSHGGYRRHLRGAWRAA